MRVFVTGASGFIGSVTVKDLIAHGHQVLGLARSDDSAKAVAAAGAEVLRGSLTDLESLREGAESCDGVIHTAFIHDFSDWHASIATDQRAIETLGAALAGSGKPLVVAAGVFGVTDTGLATEDQPLGPDFPRRSEPTALAYAAKGVRASAVRLPPTVHGAGDKGFAPMLIAIARTKGVSAYVGDGSARWPAVHRADAASLFRLALEHGGAGAAYHAIADEGVPTRDIAEAIGRGLGVPVVSKTPEEAAEHFGFLGMFFGTNCAASSAKTRAELGWQPTHASLIPDMEQHYFNALVEQH